MSARIERQQMLAPSDHRASSAAAQAQSLDPYIVTAVPTALTAETVGAVRARLIEPFDDASHLFILHDDGRLAGIGAIASVMNADAASSMASLLHGEKPVPQVDSSADRERAASAAIRSGRGVLAVCGADGRFVGAVPAGALMRILRDEHLEDLHRLAGILGRADAVEAERCLPPYRQALNRLPWLLIGMAGSALATLMMARFEAPLTAHIAVAFFVPGIVYLADAVGTQSEVVTIRGLSLVDGSLYRMFFGELLTSILVGGVLGAIALPLVWVAFGNSALAATVACAILAASVAATAVGILLPYAFAKAGCDPALASGPIATVLQDMLSLLAYFSAASLLIF